jgi:ABC-type Fe3+ transport system substrate-binding protein
MLRPAFAIGLISHAFARHDNNRRLPVAIPHCRKLVQLMGEAGGFDYLKKLHRNVNQYTKSCAAPAKATSLGETLVGITFQHDMVTFIVDGAPIKVVAPCEGTG